VSAQRPLFDSDLDPESPESRSIGSHEMPIYFNCSHVSKIGQAKKVPFSMFIIFYNQSTTGKRTK